MVEVSVQTLTFPLVGLVLTLSFMGQAGLESGFFVSCLVRPTRPNPFGFYALINVFKSFTMYRLIADNCFNKIKGKHD